MRRIWRRSEGRSFSTLKEVSNSCYIWTCPIDREYYRRSLLLFLLVFGSRYVELWGRVAKMRVYAPEEDMEFVKRHIRNRLTGGCDIRYIS